MFYNATYGIYLARSHNCFIEENISHGNAQNEILGGNGIHLWYSDDNTIRQNVLKGHRDGIYFEFSQNLHVEKNVATENIRYGLHFMFCHNSIITENRYFMNATGVALMYSKNLNLTANEFSDSRGPSMQGILLKDITDSTVQKNKIAHNTTGLLADNSSRNKIQQNTFVMNGRALEVFGNAQDNRFENNSFLQNIFDVAVNSKENTNTYEKNYWDKYKGYDLNHDGIGDVSFHPVQIFSFWVSKYPELSILAGSSMIYFLEIIERAFPVLTPTSLRDMRPLMQKPIYTRM
ncbi:MAG TPA: nitrous oxide reductase family maturation protein NosD [Turneriella sp.]|nr:nitrous oxide reductase family maturation protein NosD [Turneriella sp.]